MWIEKLSWVLGAAGLAALIAGCAGSPESVAVEEPAAQKPAEDEGDRKELETDLFRDDDVGVIESNLPPDYDADPYDGSP